jgi:hypothetical protein
VTVIVTGPLPAESGLDVWSGMGNEFEFSWGYTTDDGEDIQQIRIFGTLDAPPVNIVMKDIEIVVSLPEDIPEGFYVKSFYVEIPAIANNGLPVFESVFKSSEYM